MRHSKLQGNKSFLVVAHPWRALEAADLTALSGQVPDFGIFLQKKKSLVLF
jgi:hypothetical protein